MPRDLFFEHRTPTRIGVETVNPPRNLQRIRTEVFFINNAVLADHEGLDTGYSILGRCGEEGEATNHHTLHNIIEFSQRRRGSLAFEDLEEIAAIRFITTRVTARNSFGD